MDSPLATACALCLVPVALVWWSRENKGNGLPLPPGPRPLPLLGNALQINITEPWITYADWGRRYGGIVYSRLLGQDFIIINDEKIARALLDQRGAIYSDRPVIGTNKLFGVDFNTGLLPYGDTWRVHRKILNQTLRGEVVASYHDLYLRKAYDFALNLMDSPGGLEAHVQMISASLIMAVTYGYEVQTHDDPLVNRIQQVVDIITQVLTPERGALLMAFPLLEHLPAWFPGAAFKRLARPCRELVKEIMERPFEYVKGRMAQGKAPQSMVSDFLTQLHGDSGDAVTEQEQVMMEVAATVFIGGSETTSSTLYVFLLAMVLYPEVQERAHAEISAVVGNDRLPDFDDRSSLPYVEAICRETLRWQPVVPLSLPHATSSDDTYEGYFIPKGAVVIINTWGMTHDETRYPDAASFKPERHFNPDGQLKDEPIPVNLGFGLGRRICPGRHFADRSMWAAVVMVLASLRLTKATGPAGGEIEVRPDFTTGLAMSVIASPPDIECTDGSVVL
ncbi:cytochrome P450 [Leucogyrophana mollusca]|uniref:Cytochrome P450 n=1 Tax=Leucogyrophana mollusca TaxID=85980 RepID=A0ACB8AW24_9AGAM|nr:cytochrome P450 [Leucogyrophana mollusca]